MASLFSRSRALTPDALIYLWVGPSQQPQSGLRGENKLKAQSMTCSSVVPEPESSQLHCPSFIVYSLLGPFQSCSWLCQQLIMQKQEPRKQGIITLAWSWPMLDLLPFISTFHTKNTTSLQGHACSSALHSGRMLEQSSEVIYSVLESDRTLMLWETLGFTRLHLL